MEVIKKVLKRNAIKAYKVFNVNWTCRDYQYEVGKTFKHEGQIRICDAGFHACKRLSDCFKYYPFDHDKIKVAEVLLWGHVSIDPKASDSKMCASCITIVKELMWDDVILLCNTGSRNTGNWNSGDWNSGNCNSGNCNTGNWNSGNRNIGDGNTGNRNTGDWNSGNRNTGNWNSGNWNSGDWNSGWFNTPAQEYIFMFNKPVNKSVLDSLPYIPFLYFSLTTWVCIDDMTPEEKLQHPECDVTGGYLKTYEYKEAFRKSFEKAKQQGNWSEQLTNLKSLPNFDAKIFEEISGIREEELV